MGRVMALILLSIFVTGGGVLIMTNYREKIDNAQLFYVTESFGEDPVKITQEDIVYPVLLSAGVGLLIITGITMLFYSHRIAGPVYKIKKNLDEMGQDNIGLDIKLRKWDEFKELAESLNKVKRKMEEETKRKEIFGGKLSLIKERLRHANTGLNQHEIQELIKDIEAA